MPLSGEYNAFRSNMKINAKITDWLEVGANVNFQDRSDGDIQVSLGKKIKKHLALALTVGSKALLL